MSEGMEWKCVGDECEKSEVRRDEQLRYEMNENDCERIEWRYGVE